jgi:methionyl-tRNA synthetase
MAKEIKCPHCGEWTNTNSDNCNYCGKELKPDRTDENERLHNFRSLDIPLITINEDDHWFIKAVKMVLRTGQVIFLFIASVLVYIASGLAH